MKLRYLLLLILTAFFAVSCGSSSSTTKDEHGHDHSDGSSCSASTTTTKADAHNHAEGESCGSDDGHNHAADDGHNHASGESCSSSDGHNHAAADAHDHSDEIEFTKKQAELVGLQTETVAPNPFRSVIKTSGSIVSPQGGEEIVVATQNGIVHFSNQYLTEGAAIKEGAAVAIVSSRNLAEGDQTVKVRIAYENAKKEWERAQLLVVDNIISQREAQQIELTFQNAKTAYEAMSSNVTKDGVKVPSPMTGYLKNRLVSQGQYVTVGEPIATIARNQKLQLRADVSQRNYRQLNDIVTANFKTDYDNSVVKLSELGGRLVSSAKNVDAQSYYIPVIFEFNNVGNTLPGSFVEVYLLGKEQPDAISIPVSALTEEQGVYYVYLQAHEESFKKQEVSLGSSNGERVEILKGLKSGDKVVTKGAIQVKLASASGDIPHGHEH